MNIVAALLGEHGSLLHLLDTTRLAAPRFDAAQWRTAGLLLAEAIESHAHLEDDLLFSPLEASGRMPSGPVGAMRVEHDQIHQLLDQLATASEPDAGMRALARLADLLRHHFAHEEHALFAIATRVLPEAELQHLGGRWAAHRGVTVSALGEPAAATFATGANTLS